MAPQDAIGMEKCITFCFKILHLLQAIHGLVCKRKECGRALEYRQTFCGTCLVVSWQCSAGHFGGSWASHPKCEGVRAGNLLLASSICLSGNSFKKVGLLFYFFKSGFISKSLFNQYQHLYIAPAVSEYWENMKVDLWKDRDGREVILSGDARNDSSGHCAQYCTYSLGDMETKTILNMNIIDVREVEGRKSNNMERCVCVCVCKESNASTTLICFVENAPKYNGIVHQRDVWHGAKNVTKKVIDVSIF